MTTPPLDVERAAIGWRIARASGDHEVQDFAYQHMGDILTEVFRLRDRLALAEQQHIADRTKLDHAHQRLTEATSMSDLRKLTIASIEERLALAEQALAHPAYAWVRDALADGRIITKLIPPQDCLHGIRYAGFYCQDYDGPGLDETTPP